VNNTQTYRKGCFNEDRNNFTYEITDAFGKFVSWYSHGGYTHASISIDEDEEIFYSFNYKGFVIEKPKKRRTRSRVPLEVYDNSLRRKFFTAVICCRKLLGLEFSIARMRRSFRSNSDARFWFFMINGCLSAPTCGPSMYLSVMGIASLIKKMD
jgi:hypothetical protein